MICKKSKMTLSMGSIFASNGQEHQFVVEWLNVFKTFQTGITPDLDKYQDCSSDGHGLGARIQILI
jgi:hypothetical protein